MLGFVQRFGIGIQTAQAELRRNGNPPIEFTVEATTVTCVLRAAPVNAQVNQSQDQILRLIKADAKISYDELATRLKKDRTTVMRNIKKLKEAGILKRIGPDKTGSWQITLAKNSKGA